MLQMTRPLGLAKNRAVSGHLGRK